MIFGVGKQVQDEVDHVIAVVKSICLACGGQLVVEGRARNLQSVT